MKKFLVGTLLFLSSIFHVAACVFSPYGEDLRYRFLNPLQYGMEGYQRFFYNAHSFDPTMVGVHTFDSNIWDWHHYLGKKVDALAIENFLYHSSSSDLNAQSENDFVKYLYANKKEAIINYLHWAKQCEEFTTDSGGKSWERDQVKLKKTATSFLNELKEQIKKERDTYLKRRYAFLAVRLAFYVDDLKAIKHLYNDYFAKGKKDFLYYWSLYFHCFTNERKDIDLANIVRYSPEKRNAIFYHFRDVFSLEKALAEASSDDERANAYAFLGMQNIDKNLHNLRQIYQRSPKNDQLDFLLLRELSKLEDWIYTPYYTYYLPSIQSYDKYLDDSENGDGSYVVYALELKKRAELNAREYAKELLAFVKSCDFTGVKNVKAWKSAVIQLQFMTQEYSACIQNAKLFLKKYAADDASIQIEKLMILASVAKQNTGKATIASEHHTFVLKHIGDERFKFALARELEFHGNYGDAIALMSNLSREYSYEEYPGLVYWQFQRKENNRTKGTLVEFWEYFSYVDYAYSIKQLEAVLASIENHPTSTFYTELYKKLNHDKNYISDLLGMKYIRQNDLKGALKVYEAMDQTYWENNYSAWERDAYDGGYYCFDKNPFYQLKYTPDFIEPNAKIKLTKVNVLKQLIYHLERAEDPTNARRDKDYFYAATCYYNMSKHGNAWMMRRFASTWYYSDELSYYNEMYEDEEEYRYNLMAQKYYLLAEKFSRNEKFKALCYRMYEFALEIDNRSDEEEKDRYEGLKEKYPSEYESLSSCDFLRDYFK